MNTRAVLTGRVRLLLLVAVVGLGAATFAGRATAGVTTYKSGSYGSWLGYGTPNMCTGNFSSGGVNVTQTPGIDTISAHVSRTASYPNSTQTIWMIPRVDFSSDGVHWYLHSWGSWQGQTVGPNYFAAFQSRFIDVSTRVQQGYHYFRVLEVFQWYVGSTKVGEVWDLFNSGEYFFNGGSVLSNEPSGCYIR